MTTYIQPPVVIDPDQLMRQAIATIQAAFPGWIPNAGDLDTILLEINTRMAAENGTIASASATSIYRSIGPIVGVNPIDAAPASATTTWTANDDSGYTVAAGTTVGIRDSSGNLIPFQVVADVTIMSGDVATADGGVSIVAVTPGAAASGLGTDDGPVELIDVLDWVTSVALVAPTSGGVDAQTDSDYLNELTAELQLLSSHLVLPADFAAAALTIAGIDRVLILDGYDPARNAVQTINVVGTGGTFVLHFGGHDTGALANNIIAADLQTALRGLVSIGAGGCVVTGGPGNSQPFTVTFTGARAGAAQAAITRTSSLTGPGAVVTVTVVVAGNAATTGNPREITAVPLDSAGNDSSGGATTALAALYAARREVNFISNIIGATRTAIDVSFTVNVSIGYDPAAVVATAEAALAAFLDPSSWGIPLAGNRSLWNETLTVRQLDLATVLGTVQGVAHITVLELCVGGGSPSTADVTIPGPGALTTAGTITGTSA